MLVWPALYPTAPPTPSAVTPPTAQPAGPITATRGGTYVESKDGRAGTYLPIGRGWPRLAEAGGRPALDLALAGPIKAGGRMGRSILGGSFHMGRYGDHRHADGDGGTGGHAKLGL